MAEGARFEVHLTKVRGILGDDARPFEANLITEGNALHWQVREIEDVELEELKRLLDEGYSIRDCAEEMGKSKSAVHRLKRKLEGLAWPVFKCPAVPALKQRYSGTPAIFVVSVIL